MMALQKTVLLLLVVAVTSQARVLHPKHDSVLISMKAVESAAEGIEDELEGFAENAQTFFMQLVTVAQSFEMKEMEAIVPVIEACPADILKTTVVDLMKAVASLLKDLEGTVDEYNPLHPKSTGLVRSLVRRAAPSTLSSFGGALGKVFDAVDDLVVNVVAEAVKYMKQAGMGLDLMISQFDQVPPEFFKEMLVQGMKQAPGTGPF